MIRVSNKNKGAIAVFMSLVIFLTFVFGCLVIDGTRIIGSKSIIMGAGDLAMNAALSNYDAELKDIYGLLGMKESNTDESVYFENTLNAGKDNGKYGGLIQLDSEMFSLQKVNGSQVCETEPMRQQILEYSKYRSPLAFGDEMLDKIRNLRKKAKVAKAVNSQLKVSEKFKEVDEVCKTLKEKLEIHNRYCVQKPSDREIADLEIQMDYYYLRISTMLKIEAAISYYEKSEQNKNKTTKELVNTFLTALENVDINSDQPEKYFSSIMAALDSSMSISSNDLDEMVSNAISEDEKTELEQLRRDYQAKSSWIDRYRNKVASVKRSYVWQAYNDILNKYHRLGDDIISSARDVYPVIEEIIDMLENNSNGLQTAMEEWKENIEQLEGAEKEEQQNQYDKYRELMDSSSIRDIKGCLEDNEEYFQKFKAYWESYEYCDVQLYQVTEPRSEFTSKAGRYSTSKYTNKGLEDVAKRFFENEFKHWNYSETMTGMMYRNLNEHPYFIKLKEIFGESVNEETEQKKNDNLTNAQNQINELLNNILGLQDADWSGTIPSEWLAQGGADSGSEDGTMLETESNKKISSSARRSMNASTELLECLSNVLENLTEDLLITEYAMQMFCYYTVERGLDGKQLDPKDIVSLSGFKFSKGSTAMYRSEIEYLLWGNRSAIKNVTYTMTTVMSIRLLLNIVSAFTNPHLISETASMSSSALFGAPLLQAALILASALLETAKDMSNLVQGKPVYIVKNSNQWTTYYIRPSISRSINNGFDTLTYKEYLRIFLLINNLSDTKQEKMLARMADCMQFNLRKVSKNPVNITEAYTMVSVEANVSVKTTFLKKIPQAININADRNYDNFVIHYKSVLAY